MFGVYYLAIAIGQKLAHYVGGDIDKITQEYSLSGFFLIFTIIPIILGVLSIVHMYVGDVIPVTAYIRGIGSPTISLFH